MSSQAVVHECLINQVHFTQKHWQVWMYRTNTAISLYTQKSQMTLQMLTHTTSSLDWFTVLPQTHSYQTRIIFWLAIYSYAPVPEWFNLEINTRFILCILSLPHRLTHSWLQPSAHTWMNPQNFNKVVVGKTFGKNIKPFHVLIFTLCKSMELPWDAFSLPYLFSPHSYSSDIAGRPKENVISLVREMSFAGQRSQSPCSIGTAAIWGKQKYHYSWFLMSQLLYVNGFL